MIEGKFSGNKKFGGIITVCGAFIMALFVFLGFVDNDTASMLSGLIIGFCIMSVGLCILLFNHKAFIHIDGAHIEAKFGYFTRLDCDINEISYAEFGANNMLIILLKNGKQLTVTGLENGFEIRSTILSKISFEPIEDTEKAKTELAELKTKQKSGIVPMCICLVLMFALIFITVVLTGERELHEFSSFDWILFAAMGAVGIVNLAFTFYFARLGGSVNVKISRLEYAIRRSIVEWAPVAGSASLKYVFTDAEYTGRILIFENEQSGIWLHIQELDGDYNLRIESEGTADNMDDLISSLEGLTDITDKVYR